MGVSPRSESLLCIVSWQAKFPHVFSVRLIPGAISPLRHHFSSRFVYEHTPTPLNSSPADWNGSGLR